MEKAINWHQEQLSREADESDRAFASRCRAKACDLVRFFLPAGTLTNVGWTVNARQLEYGISKLLSSDLIELQELGNDIKKEAITHVPTLVKYANPNDYLTSCEIPSRELPAAIHEERFVAEDAQTTNEVQLVNYDPDAEDKVIASLAYPFAGCAYDQLLSHVRGLSPDEKEQLLRKAIGSPRSFDAGPRALETTAYTFEITLDYGAWRDIQRHRMCTQLIQKFSPELGYVEPTPFAAIGLAESYRRARELSVGLHHRLEETYPADAVYPLLLGFRVRTVFDMNLREAYRFARLRSSPHGHQSYRKVAVDLWRQIERAHPLLARYLTGVHPFNEDTCS